MIIAIKILMSGVGSSVNQDIRKKKKKDALPGLCIRLYIIFKGVF